MLRLVIRVFTVVALGAALAVSVWWWLHPTEDLNRRLDITELRLCTVEHLSGDELAALRNMAQPDGYFAAVTRRMDELRVVLDRLSPVHRWLARPRYSMPRRALSASSS